MSPAAIGKQDEIAGIMAVGNRDRLMAETIRAWRCALCHQPEEWRQGDTPAEELERLKGKSPIGDLLTRETRGSRFSARLASGVTSLPPRP
jgi:hypothetical protein